MDVSLKIEKEGYTIEDVKFPEYFVESTSNIVEFVKIKGMLSELFSAFYHSEDFKNNGCTEDYRTLHYCLDEMLDDLVMAQHLGWVGQMLKSGKIDLYNQGKVEPTKEVF